MMLGIFDPALAERDGYAVWTTPCGNRVTVTSVAPAEEAWKYRLPDAVRRGEVVAYIETIWPEQACSPPRVTVPGQYRLYEAPRIHAFDLAGRRDA